MALPVRVGFDVAEVADVALGVVGAGVRHSGGVEVAAGALAVGHRAVAEFVNVEAMFAGLQAGELADDFNAAVLLRERDFAFHFVVAEAVHDGDGHSDLVAHVGMSALPRQCFLLRLGSTCELAV